MTASRLAIVTRTCLTVGVWLSLFVAILIGLFTFPLPVLAGILLVTLAAARGRSLAGSQP